MEETPKYKTPLRIENFILFLMFLFFQTLGRPFPLQNCSITNQSADSIQVDCIEGFDGGLPQSFMLELVELNNLRLARNITLQVSISKRRIPTTQTTTPFKTK